MTIHVQFATIVVKALGLTPKANSVFSDVPTKEWYASYVGTAYAYGIVNGRSATTFDPEGTITRQEAAAMVARAAKLCGMDTELETYEILNALAQFGDYVTVDTWAQESMAFCYSEDILDQNDLDIEPKRPRFCARYVSNATRLIYPVLETVTTISSRAIKSSISISISASEISLRLGCAQLSRTAVVSSRMI